MLVAKVTPPEQRPWEFKDLSVVSLLLRGFIKCLFAYKQHF